MLGDRDEQRLVVCGSVDATNAVITFRETFSDGGRHLVVHSGPIHALEKRENSWVQWGRVLDTLDFLNDKVRVANDLALLVELLRGGEVVGDRVDEAAGLHANDVHGDFERSIGGDSRKVHCITWAVN